MFKRYTNKNLEFSYSALMHRHLEWIVKLQWFSLLLFGIYLLLKGYCLPALCAAGLGISFSFMNFLILNILAELREKADSTMRQHLRIIQLLENGLPQK